MFFLPLPAERRAINNSGLGSFVQHRLFAPVVIGATLLIALVGGQLASETWQVKSTAVGGQDVVQTDALNAATEAVKSQVREERVSSLSVIVTPAMLDDIDQKLADGQAITFDDLQAADAGGDDSIRLTVGHHLGFWSILPAIITLVNCLIFREPLPALMLGIVSAALVLGRFNLTDEVLLPGLATTSAAGILLLYLWLLGGLLGVWSKTGAALAFADWTCRTFVRGPRSAKLVAWVLGVLFFQGGTVSTVLVGTTVRPITERNKISPEELAYVVDSTASPIASLIAFNAWPAYVAALIFVPGVEYLATVDQRIDFFFHCAPLSFYSIFAVLGTLLLSIDRAPFLGKRFRAAIARARAVKPADPNMAGKTDAETSKSQGSGADARSDVAKGYSASPLEFAIPLVALIGIAVGTGFLLGNPQVRWAFASALVIAGMIALCRGLSVTSLVEGIGDGLKSVTVVSVILVLAVVLGGLTKELGGGLYVSNVIGENIPHIILPAVLFVLTASMAFATGTSFGTYAIAFPLTMPLSISIAAGMEPDAGSWFVMICFASVLNGSVFGDQCSPISDTTILSSLVSNCDLMEHVRTQLVPASLAGGLAMAAWTALAIWVT